MSKRRFKKSEGMYEVARDRRGERNGEGEDKEVGKKALLGKLSTSPASSSSIPNHPISYGQ
jgi:hypothetical protein